MSFSVFLVYIVVIMLALYGGIKVFDKVRTEWRDFCARSDSEAAQRREAELLISGLPDRIDRMERLHKDLSDKLKETNEWLSRESSRRYRMRDRFDAEHEKLRGELTDIQKALRGHI